jgi:filamentous hemagglutinin
VAKRLAQQAFREVQFGAEGQTDADAQAFLKKAGNQLLPGDPNISDQTVGYMFKADPVQKATPNMYASAVVNDPNALSFYAKNSITQPTVAQIQTATAKDAKTRQTLTNATLGAAGLAAAVTLPPALSWCLMNPVACNRIVIAGGEIASGDALGPMGLAIGGVVAGKAGLNAVRSAEEVNAVARAAGWNPQWSLGTPVINAELKTGTKLNMIIDADTAKGISDAQRSGDFSKVNLGGWATFDDVSSIAVDMRQRAANTGEFKPSSSGPFYVVELDVKKPVQANLGYAGEQLNKELLPNRTLLTTNSTLRGGASHAEFLIPRDMRTTYLRPTSAPKELGR